MNNWVTLFSAAGLLALAASVGASPIGPVVFWASTPVAPGETVMLVGTGLEGVNRAVVQRLPDGEPGHPSNEGLRLPIPTRVVTPEQVTERSVKFVLPDDEKRGVYAVQVAGANGRSEATLVNRPDLRWVQGDRGLEATAGGWARGFGLGLAAGTARPVIFLMGPRRVRVPAEGDSYAVRGALPEDLPTGDYQVFVHTGFGGRLGWSEGRLLRVVRAETWPDTVYDVRAYGARGNGRTDDSGAVGLALAAIAQAGGGVLYFPRGRYLLTQTVELPRFTTLRGERSDLTSLTWPDTDDPLPALVRGSNSFAVENITIYCANHAHVLVGDLGNRPGAGQIALRGVRVRANMYRGHVIDAEDAARTEEVARRFAAALKFSSGGPDTVRLGGANIEITDCDFYGSGRSLFLSRVRGGLVARNSFVNGRWGWYCISGSDGLVFEDNEIRGGDLMSTGGGINCLDGSRYSGNVYYARNTVQDLWGWDREAMTSDAGGGAYLGRVAGVEGVTLTLASDPGWRGRGDYWKGAGVFLLEGRGAGQYRRLAAYDGRRVTLDKAFTVPPDETTVVSITLLQENYLVIGNQFSDATTAIQFYGISIGHVVAENRSTRAGGFHNLGLNYHGFQPSWYIQYFDNEIVEGSGALGPLNQWPAEDSHLAVISSSSGEYVGPLARFAVLRRNGLRNNARIEVAGPATDVLIEDNSVEHSDVGVYLAGETAGIMLRRNRFENVAEPLAGDGVAKAVVRR